MSFPCCCWSASFCGGRRDSNSPSLPPLWTLWPALGRRSVFLRRPDSCSVLLEFRPVRLRQSHVRAGTGGTCAVLAGTDQSSWRAAERYDLLGRGLLGRSDAAGIRSGRSVRQIVG